MQFTLAATVDAGKAGGVITNTATLTLPDGLFDPNTANNTSSAAVLVERRLYLPLVVRQ